MMIQVLNSDVVTGENNFVPIQRAANVTGQSVRHWRRIAEQESNRAAITGKVPLAIKRTPPGGRGRPTWWVHVSLHPLLSRCPDRKSREDRTRDSLVKRYPAHAVDDAYRKARWLRKWRQSLRRSHGQTERQCAEQIIDEAYHVEGPDFSISFRSLQAWHRAYQATGPDRNILGVEGLIDRRAVASRKRGSDVRSREAVEYFLGIFRTQSKHSIKTCHANTLQRANVEGWSWPGSYSATVRWLDAHDDVSLSYLMREGNDAWCRRFMPHIENDPTMVEPGQFYQTDHHRCDYWVEHEGKQLRPWLTTVIDYRSRMIVGWHLGVTPHQDAIISAYLMAFRTYAIPETMKIDNGRDFTSKLLTGVTKTERDVLRRQYGKDWRNVLRRDENLIDIVDGRFAGITEELGIDMVYCTPYAPWGKGPAERWYRTFEDHCGKLFATYCGNSALSKPECLDAIRNGYTKDQKRRLRSKHGRDWKRAAVLRFVDARSVPTLDEARASVADYIELYHGTPHTGEGMNGRTPLQVWNTAKSLRRADDMALMFLMQARGVYHVTANGVTLTMGGTRMKYGAGNPELYRFTGRDVFITVDPNDVSFCHAFTADRKQFIGRLEPNRRISPLADMDTLREANAAVGRRRKVRHRAMREAPLRTRNAVDELNANRREQLAELRATGTNAMDAVPKRITPVKTGFESSAEQVENATRAPKRQRDRSDMQTTAELLSRGTTLTPKTERRKRASLELSTGDRNREPAAGALHQGRGEGPAS